MTQLSKSAPSDKPDWKGVAAQMKEKGFQVTGTECRNRWHVYQKYIHKGLRSCADWTPDEVRLRSYCPIYRMIAWRLFSFSNAGQTENLSYSYFFTL